MKILQLKNIATEIKSSMVGNNRRLGRTEKTLNLKTEQEKLLNLNNREKIYWEKI